MMVIIMRTRGINIRKIRGFTLIEIMVVFAITGFIISIAVPTFMRQRELSRSRGCQENLLKIDGAKEMYAMDNSLPDGADVDLSDLVRADGTGYLRREPLCPSGGTYTANPIGTDPSCSYYGQEPYGVPDHVLPITR